MGDEGGFAPAWKTRSSHPADPASHRKTGYTAGDQIALGLDCAASEFYKDGMYVLEVKAICLKLTARNGPTCWHRWCDKYPIISIEDGMHEGDWDGWKLLTERLGRRCNWWATTCS